MENKSDRQPKRDVGVMWKCTSLGQDVRNGSCPSVSPMRRPFCDCRGRKPGVSRVKMSPGCEMGLGAGPGGQRPAAQLDGLSQHEEFQQPEHSRPVWLQRLQSMAASSPLSILEEMEVQQSKSEMPLGPSSTTCICSYPPSTFFTYVRQ